MLQPTECKTENMASQWIWLNGYGTLKGGDPRMSWKSDVFFKKAKVASRVARIQLLRICAT